jgi:hypothetical protein
MQLLCLLQLPLPSLLCLLLALLSLLLSFDV